MRESRQYRNNIEETLAGKLWSINTVPKFGIGQRAIFVQEGNVLWDCISYLDQPTIEFLYSKGGVKAICISHPHYYSTSVEWAKTFACKVWIFGEDKTWIARPDSTSYNLLEANKDTANIHHHVPVSEDLVFAKIGGHFPGSAILYSKKDHYILVGDTVSLTPGNRRVTIMWSYPNMIPLDVKTIAELCWPRLAAFDFDSIYAKFLGEEIGIGAKAIMEDSFSFYCKKLGGSLYVE